VIEVDILDRQALASGLPSAAEIRRLCRQAAAAAGVHDGHLAVEFVGAARIAELNATYRDEPSPTDVLSFPIDRNEPSGEGGVCELGDVVICAEQTVELREAIIHGVLHLAGMDHETDDGEMMALQRALIAAESE